MPRPDGDPVARLCDVDIYAERGVLEASATTRYDIERGDVLVIADRDATPDQVQRGWVLIKADGSIE